MKKRILHVIDSLGVGGAEKLLAGMINGLDEYEHHLIILRSPENLRSSITAPYHFLNLNCGSFRQLFSRVSVVKKYIKLHKINLVHSHLYEANLLARLATPRRVRLINSIHAISSQASYKINKMSLYLEKFSYKKRHEIITVSHAVLEDFRQWVGIKGPHTVLYNYIDDKYFELTPRQHFSVPPLKLVAVGNLRWQKNYPYLLQAFKKTAADVHLDIYGEGALRESLQQEIDKHGLNIRLCGIHNNMEQVLPQYDAFVMSSFYEGQPVSLLEAMACGLPAVLADIPVLKEVTGDAAVYFDINDPDSFGKKIQQLLEGKYNLQQMAVAGHQKVNEFAHRQQHLQRLRAIYNAGAEVYKAFE